MNIESTLKKISNILKDEGCSDIFLFGCRRYQGASSSILRNRPAQTELPDSNSLPLISE